MNRVFIGYDRTEHLAYQLCQYSIERMGGIGLPLIQDLLRIDEIYTRPIDVKASTDFSLTRFCVPKIPKSDTWILYCDCDFIFTQPINDLFDLADERYAVMVVKHDYVAKHVRKMRGKTQYHYPRKNWSSLILWNCHHPSNQDIPFNTAEPKALHRFSWLKDDEIGSLPRDWNFLVGEYQKMDTIPAGIHYTNGTPDMNRYDKCDYHEVWDEHVKQRESNV